MDVISHSKTLLILVPPSVYLQQIIDIFSCEVIRAIDCCRGLTTHPQQFFHTPKPRSDCTRQRPDFLYGPHLCAQSRITTQRPSANFAATSLTSDTNGGVSTIRILSDPWCSVLVLIACSVGFTLSLMYVPNSTDGS